MKLTKAFFTCTTKVFLPVGRKNKGSKGIYILIPESRIHYVTQKEGIKFADGIRVTNQLNLKLMALWFGYDGSPIMLIMLKAWMLMGLQEVIGLLVLQLHQLTNLLIRS